MKSLVQGYFDIGKENLISNEKYENFLKLAGRKSKVDSGQKAGFFPNYSTLELLIQNPFSWTIIIDWYNHLSESIVSKPT